MKWLKAVKQALAALLLFFLILILGVGTLLVTNYSHLGRLTKIVGLIQTQYLEEVSWETLVDGAIRGIADSLDEYSSYQDAKASEALMSTIYGRFGGIGIHISENPDRLIVARPIQNSPAAQAGLETGDEIVKIDGIEVSSITQNEAIERLRGEAGTSVTVGVFRARTQEYFEVTLTRAIINVPSVEWVAYPGDPEIAIIDISNFSVHTGEEFDAILEQLNAQHYRGYIIDLRNNLGGEFMAAVHVASRLVSEGPIVHTVDRRGRMETQDATASYMGRPFVLLVNEYSASASEIVAGAIKDNASGPLIGTTTFGKGVVQTLYELDASTGLKLTTEKYLTPLQNDIHKIGIKPDIEVKLQERERLTIRPTQLPVDSQMQKAYETLKAIS